jgi:hypothetical protein
MTTSTQMTTRHSATASASQPVVAVLCVLGAALLVVSGLIHLHLWRGPYRHLTTGHMNTLFLIQVISCFVLAVAVIALRNVLAVLAAAGLMAGTFIGFLISRYRTAGLFGFHLPFSSSDAKWALTVEIAATVLFLITALVMVRGARSKA